MQERFFDRRRGQASLWVASLVATVALATYQRVTGPTYAIAAHADLGGSAVTGRLERSAETGSGALIMLGAADPQVSGAVEWRRYPTADPWETIPLERIGSRLIAELPELPAAGKLEYVVRVRRGEDVRVLPERGSAVLRYKGHVPGWILAPHILLMFLALVLGTRAALGGLAGESLLERHIPWLLAFLVPGGLVLGPVVQKRAFGSFWAGWPIGEDLTDTKTLVSVAAWVAAWLLARRAPAWKRAAILGAAAVMLAVYLIPHSVRGSQIDWDRDPRVTHDSGGERAGALRLEGMSAITARCSGITIDSSKEI